MPDPSATVHDVAVSPAVTLEQVARQLVTDG
jgi:hypothetical protein